MHFKDNVLNKLEEQMVSCVRSWFFLNISSIRSFMFSPHSQGGLGLPKQQTIYYAERLSFFLSILLYAYIVHITVASLEINICILIWVYCT